MTMASGQSGTAGTVALTVRLPAALHEWLRDEAHWKRTTMNAIVIRELEELRAASQEAEQELGRTSPQISQTTARAGNGLVSWG